MKQPKRAGKTVAAGVAVAAAVGVALVATIFMRGGGSGDGAGSGTGPASGTGSGTGAAALPAAFTPAQTQQAPPDAPVPQRPLKVTVRESTYLVNGREVDLAQLGELAAKVPEGSGPAVMIERDATSRAKAEQDLVKALDERKLSHASD